MVTNKLFLTFATALAASVMPNSAHAKLFRNSYITFELPDRWECALIDTEWVCKNTDRAANRDKEAIIILTAKEVGPADTPQAYEAHLKSPRVLPSPFGAPIQSRIFRVTQRLINGQTWVDGMHDSSEVRDYYTRYLATTKDKIAVLVTFSSYKTVYSKYTNDFFKAIESLHVTNPKYLLNQTTLASTNGRETLGGNLQATMPADFGEDFPMEGSGQGGGSGMVNTVLGIALLLGAIGAYLLLKKRKGAQVRR